MYSWSYWQEVKKESLRRSGIASQQHLTVVQHNEDLKTYVSPKHDATNVQRLNHINTGGGVGVKGLRATPPPRDSPS